MNKLIILITLLLSVVVLDCHAQPFRYTQVPASTALKVKPIWIDKSFSAADKIAIDDAIAEWNYVLNGTIVLKPVSYEFDMEVETIQEAIRSHGLLVLKINSENAMVDGPTTAAWVNKLGGTNLYVVRDRVGYRLKKIMLHEIGHALGAAHQPGFTLMFEHYDDEKYSCIDAATIKQVATYNLISMSNMNHCVYIR